MLLKTRESRHPKPPLQFPFWRVSAALWLVGAAAAQEPPSFAKDVYPIFANYCLSCHNNSVKLATLSLETHQGVLQGGTHGQILVPGKSQESRLYLMVSGKTQPRMPMDGRTLAAGEIDIIRRWIDAGAKPPTAAEAAALSDSGKPTIPEIKPRGSVKASIFAIAWHPGGKLIAVAGHKQVEIREATGRQVAMLSGHADAVRAVTFSSDGKLLAAAGGLPGRSGEVKLWDSDQRTEVRTISGHADCIYGVAFSPDGKLLATSSYDKLIKVWDLATGAELRTLKDHIDAVYDLKFTPDGKRLISGAADRTVKVWDPATGERLYTMGEPTDGINAVAVHPNGKLVAAGGVDKSIRVWSLGEKSGTLVNSLIAHEDAILRLDWSPDGTRLISSAADRTVKVFSAADLTEIKTIPRQPDWVHGLRFSPDGKTFAAGRYDGSLSVYDAQFKDLLETERASR